MVRKMSKSRKYPLKKLPFSKTQYKALRKMVPIERRFQDTNWSGQTVGNTGTTLSLTPNATPRDGNQITPVGLHFSYYVVAADNYNYMRVIVFRWKADTVPATTSVIDSVAMAANRGATALYNYTNAGLFTILYDKTHYTDTDDPGSRVFQVNLKKKLGRKKIIFDGDVATAAAGQFKLYAVAVSDSGAVSHPFINADFRVTYLDA